MGSKLTPKRKLIIALEKFNTTGVAEYIGISRETLRKRMKVESEEWTMPQGKKIDELYQAFMRGKKINCKVRKIKQGRFFEDTTSELDK